MNEPVSFRQIVARTAFALSLLYVLAAPQLRSNNPGPGFDVVSNWMDLVSFLGWVGIGISILLLIAAVTAFSRLRYQNQTIVEKQGLVPAESLPISEAVKPTAGGSGLTSAPFRPYLAFFDLIGWVQIQEPEKECLVIDARHVIRNTRLYATPLRLLGKPISARRVLLSPAPLEDVSATELTADQLKLTLVVSVKYLVADPAYVAGLEAPLSELQNLLTGAIAEYIHNATLENIVHDDGTLRTELKRRLENSTTIKNRFEVIEVLKALPTGDERMIEIIRKTREEIERRTLLEQEGRNKAIEAQYDLAIEKARKELADEFEERQHIRNLEMAQLAGKFELQREIMRSIAAIAAAGINPTTAINEIRSLLLEEGQQDSEALTDTIVAKVEQIELERTSLDQIKEALGIKQYELSPVSENPGMPASATIFLDEFEVFVNCPTGYPNEAPKVHLKHGDRQKVPVIIPWREGNNLADAVTAAVMQARMMVKNKTE